MTKRAHHFSHSVLEGHSATSQKLGSPANADAPPAAGCLLLQSDGSARSAMLTIDVYASDAVEFWMIGIKRIEDRLTIDCSLSRPYGN